MRNVNNVRTRLFVRGMYKLNFGRVVTEGYREAKKMSGRDVYPRTALVSTKIERKFDGLSLRRNENFQSGVTPNLSTLGKKFIECFL